MKQSKAKLRVASKFNINQLSEQPLFSINPQASLPLLSMIGQAQLSIDDLLGQLSRQFIEKLLVLSAQTVAETKHPVRQSGDIRWHGVQCGGRSGCAGLCRADPRWRFCSNQRLRKTSRTWGYRRARRPGRRPVGRRCKRPEAAQP